MGIEQLRADQQRWNEMFGGKSPRANGRPERHAKPRNITGQPRKVSVTLRNRLQREFGIGCTGCFSVTLAQLDTLSIEQIRSQSSEIASSIRENAHEAARLTNGRTLIEWAKANGNGDSLAAYERLVVEACDACTPIDQLAQREKWKGNPPFPSIEKRNLLMHIWPVNHGVAWQTALMSVLDRLPLFNGKRIIAVATDKQSHSVNVVRDMVRGYDIEIIDLQNISKLREVASQHSLWSAVESSDPSEATFYCHSKGVTRASTDAVHLWSRVMFETCLDRFDAVDNLLSQYPAVGTFKKRGAGFRGSVSDWHFSGSFYWIRNAELFRRDWRTIDQQWWGIESWPSLLFAPEESGSILLDGEVGPMNLYDWDYWKTTALPKYEAWRGSTAP